MAQVVAEAPCEVRPVVQRVHLVDAHVASRCGVRLDGVEQRHRLAVAERDDHVATHVLHHGVRRHRARVDHRRCCPPAISPSWPTLR